MEYSDLLQQIQSILTAAIDEGVSSEETARRITAVFMRIPFLEMKTMAEQLLLPAKEQEE